MLSNRSTVAAISSCPWEGYKTQQRGELFVNPTTLMKYVAVMLIASLLNIACTPSGDDQLSTSVEPSDDRPKGATNDALINNAASEPGNWLAHGLDYREQRFSPLRQISRIGSNSDLNAATKITYD